MSGPEHPAGSSRSIRSHLPGADRVGIHHRHWLRMKYTKSLMREGSPENIPQRGVERQEERPFSSLVFLVGEVGLRNRLNLFECKGGGGAVKADSTAHLLYLPKSVAL